MATGGACLASATTPAFASLISLLPALFLFLLAIAAVTPLARAAARAFSLGARRLVMGAPAASATPMAISRPSGRSHATPSRLVVWLLALACLPTVGAGGKGKKHFYGAAVPPGPANRVPGVGVATNWELCHRWVHGQSHACYKGHATAEQCIAFLAAAGYGHAFPPDGQLLLDTWHAGLEAAPQVAALHGHGTPAAPASTHGTAHAYAAITTPMGTAAHTATATTTANVATLAVVTTPASPPPAPSWMGAALSSLGHAAAAVAATITTAATGVVGLLQPAPVVTINGALATTTAAAAPTAAATASIVTPAIEAATASEPVAAPTATATAATVGGTAAHLTASLSPLVSAAHPAAAAAIAEAVSAANSASTSSPLKRPRSPPQGETSEAASCPPQSAARLI